jgi:hypothetical protein
MKTTDPTATHDTQLEKWSPPASAIFPLPAPAPVVSTSPPTQPAASSMALVPVASAHLDVHSCGAAVRRGIPIRQAVCRTARLNVRQFAARAPPYSCIHATLDPAAILVKDVSFQLISMGCRVAADWA